MLMLLSLLDRAESEQRGWSKGAEPGLAPSLPEEGQEEEVRQEEKVLPYR